MNRKNTRYNRQPSGFALIAIIGFGAISLAVLFALFPQIINAMRSEGGTRAMSELRTAASTGIDYAIQQLNDNANTNPGSVSPIDQTITAVPSKYLPNFSDGNVNIRIRQISAFDFGNYSSIYSQNLDSNPAANNWRVVESIATRGGISRSIRVFLEPRYDDPTSETEETGSSSYFKSSFLANSSMKFTPSAGSVTISSPYSASPNPAYKFALQSNGIANFGSALQLAGNVQLPRYSQPSILAGSKIDGQVITDATLEPTLGELGFKVGTTAQDTVVLGANTPPEGAIFAPPGGVTASLPAPAPSSGTTTPLPAVTNSNVLETGSYTTTSANFSSTGNSAKIDSPVKIYIQDGVSGNAATIEASSLINVSTEAANETGAAQNFQIWYNGYRDISIDLGENGTFKGLIYAPNAVVKLKGHGTFKGALVGSDVQVNTNGNTSMFIDTSLQDSANSQAKSAGLNYAKSTSSKTLQLHGYKAVTWQEIRGAIAQ
jgi:hypothetical protein